MQTDGKILVAGIGSVPGAGYETALARYNSNGSLDATFDIDGIVMTKVGSSNSYGESVTVQADDKIIVAGYGYDSISEIALTRYNSDGSLDATFDTDGIVMTKIGSSGANGRSVTVQADSKILVAGFAQSSDLNGTDLIVSLTRYNSNGSLDATFDADGIVTTNVSLRSYGQSIITQADGKILVAGVSYTGGHGFLIKN